MSEIQCESKRAIYMDLIICNGMLTICFGILFIMSFIPWMGPAYIACAYSTLNLQVLIVPKGCIYTLEVASAILLILPIAFCKFTFGIVKEHYLKTKEAFNNWKNS